MALPRPVLSPYMATGLYWAMIFLKVATALSVS